jgi:hypothetical protein
MVYSNMNDVMLLSYEVRGVKLTSNERGRRKDRWEFSNLPKREKQKQETQEDVTCFFLSSGMSVVDMPGVLISSYCTGDPM